MRNSIRLVTFCLVSMAIIFGFVSSETEWRTAITISFPVGVICGVIMNGLYRKRK